MHIQLLRHLLRAALDLQAKEAARDAAAVAEDADARTLQGIAADVCEQRHERRVHRGTIHVAALGGHHNGRLHARGELLLCKRHERLLDVLV